MASYRFLLASNPRYSPLAHGFALGANPLLIATGYTARHRLELWREKRRVAPPAAANELEEHHSAEVRE